MSQQPEGKVDWTLRRIGYAVVGSVLFYIPAAILLYWIQDPLLDSYPDLYRRIYNLDERGPYPLPGPTFALAMLIGALFPKVPISGKVAIFILSPLIGAFVGVVSWFIFEAAVSGYFVDRVATHYAALSPSERHHSPFAFPLGNELPPTGNEPPPNRAQKTYPHIVDELWPPALKGGTLCGVLFSVTAITRGRRQRMLLYVAMTAAVIGEAWLLIEISSQFVEWERRAIESMSTP